MLRPPPKSTLFPSPTLFRPNDLVNFPSSRFPAGDAKDRDAQLSAGENTLSRVGLAGRGQIGSDGNEASFAKLVLEPAWQRMLQDRKSTRLNSSHGYISYAVF